MEPLAHRLTMVLGLLFGHGVWLHVKHRWILCSVATATTPSRFQEGHLPYVVTACQSSSPQLDGVQCRTKLGYVYGCTRRATRRKTVYGLSLHRVTLRSWPTGLDFGDATLSSISVSNEELWGNLPSKTARAKGPRKKTIARRSLVNSIAGCIAKVVATENSCKLMVASFLCNFLTEIRMNKPCG